MSRHQTWAKDAGSGIAEVNRVAPGERKRYCSAAAGEPWAKRNRESGSGLKLGAALRVAFYSLAGSRRGGPRELRCGRIEADGPFFEKTQRPSEPPRGGWRCDGSAHDVDHDTDEALHGQV